MRREYIYSIGAFLAPAPKLFPFQKTDLSGWRLFRFFSEICLLGPHSCICYIARISFPRKRSIYRDFGLLHFDRVGLWIGVFRLAKQLPETAILVYRAGIRILGLARLQYVWG